MHFFLWLNNELLYGYVLPHSHANKVFEISLFLFILENITISYCIYICIMNI